MKLMSAQDAKEETNKYKKINEKTKELREKIANGINIAVQQGVYSVEFFFDFKNYPYEDYSYEVYQNIKEQLKSMGYYVDTNIYLDKAQMYISWK